MLQTAPKSMFERQLEIALAQPTLMRFLRIIPAATLDEAAEDAMVSRMTIWRLERGLSKKPRKRVVELIEKSYGYPVEELLRPVTRERALEIICNEI